MISSVTNSLAALAELPAAPGEAPGARASAGAGTPLRLGACHGLSAGVALSVGAAKTPKAASTKPKAKAAATGAGYAKAASSTKATATKASASPKKAGPLDFLDDPKLSVEDKLLKLLAYLNDKWNKDLDAKMKEFKTEKTTTTSSSSKKSSGLGGLVDKAVGFAKQAFPVAGVALDALGSPPVRSVLKSVAGPALAAIATTTGFPELAPAALKYGPELVDAAAGLASSLGSGEAAVGAAVSGGNSGTTTKTTESANTLGSDKDAQLKLMEIQRIKDQQNEMFGMVSNLLRSGHESRMALIQNLRA